MAKGNPVNLPDSSVAWQALLGDLNEECLVASLYSKNTPGAVLSRCARRMVNICRVVRQMRGGSQARLVVGDDGCYYVAKFLGNPQGNRTIINEWIASRLTQSLGIATPEVCLLSLSDEVRKRDDLSFLVGSRRTLPHSGLHLGSKCPVDPEKLAIFDIFPSTLFPRVGNLNEFGAMFVVDRWLHSVDRRQAVFYRDRSVGSACIYRAEFIDFGMAFGGEKWTLGDNCRQGLASPINVYKVIDMPRITGAVIDRIRAISQMTPESLTWDVPREWFDPGDQQRLTKLLVRLDERRRCLASLTRRHLSELEFQGLGTPMRTSVKQAKQP